MQFHPPKRPIVQLCSIFLLFIVFFHYSSNNSLINRKIDTFRYPDAELAFDGKYANFLDELGFNDEPIKIEGDDLPDFTLVTAFSPNHAEEGKHLVVNVSLAFPERKIVVFGMDLPKSTEKWFKEACNVIYRRANLSHFPPHVTKNYFNYAFKPIIVAQALKEFGAVFWVDSSTKFPKANSDAYFLKKLKYYKSEMGPDEPLVFMFLWASHVIGVETHPDMYRYLSLTKNETIYFSPMFDAGRHLVYRTAPTMNLVYKWLVLCALEEKCMAPRDAKLPWGAKIYDGIYGNCHRFDQSALNLILSHHKQSYLGQWVVDDFVRVQGGLSVREDTKIVC